MIVSSLLNSEKYFWVKVPRTATQAYEKIFFPNRDVNTFYPHYHLPYRQIVQYCGTPTPVVGGFTVIRHPLARFISALQYIQQKKNNRTELLKKIESYEKYMDICEYCEKETVAEKSSILKRIDGYEFPNFLTDENTFYDFIYDNFDKNCQYKNNVGDVFGSGSFVKSFFVTQTYFAYHPKVKTFQYENLSSFNNWISNTLGHDVLNLEKKNSAADVPLSIDTTTTKFKNLVQYLFHDDFKVFHYT